MTAVRRTAAITAVAIVAVLVLILFLSGGSPYTVKLRLDNASQLVKGNLVQVAGTKAGSVKSILLTDDGQAEVRIEDNEDYAPLLEGMQAVIGQASLSGIANRYVDLQQGPMTAPKIDSGAVLPTSETDSVVDID